jgi:phage gp36-like protein
MLIKDKIDDDEIEDYLKIVEKLQTVARGVTYVKVDTENEEPELGQKYFVKKAEYVSAYGEPIYSSETYYKK